MLEYIAEQVSLEMVKSQSLVTETNDKIFGKSMIACMLNENCT